MPDIKIITCLKELEEKRILEYNDIVEFTVKEKTLKYEVDITYLHYLINGKNDTIFRILEINKYKLTKKIYKYTDEYINSKFGEYRWPETEEQDYPALTKLVVELYRIIEERETKYTKFTRFEIMEI